MRGSHADGGSECSVSVQIQRLRWAPNGLELRSPMSCMGSCPAEAGRATWTLGHAGGQYKNHRRPSPPGRSKAVRPGCLYRDPGVLPGPQAVRPGCPYRDPAGGTAEGPAAGPAILARRSWRGVVGGGVSPELQRVAGRRATSERTRPIKGWLVSIEEVQPHMTSGDPDIRMRRGEGPKSVCMRP